MQSSIYKEIAALAAQNEIAWVVTVIAASGSTPGKPGMKMVVTKSGVHSGTIGGGTIEKLIVERVLTKQPQQGVCWSFDLGGDYQLEKTGMICGGAQEVFIEPLFANRELYIIGGGHCGQALAELLSKTDFALTVIDNRAEWVTREKHPHVSNLIQTDFGNLTSHIKFSPEVFLVVMTHNHSLDEQVIRQLLNNEFKYLGVIGSATKTKTILQKLHQDGFSLEQLQKLFMPIGFNIGAATPQEIAISIAAQILAVARGIESITFNANPLLSY